MVAAVAADELRELLFLRDCHFTAHHLNGVTARIMPSGEVTVGNEHWSTGDLGLPTRSVDLPVRSGGWLLGHFLLTPTPGRPVSPDRLLVAVAIADQVGVALAAEDSPDGLAAPVRRISARVPRDPSHEFRVTGDNQHRPVRTGHTAG